MWNPKPCPVAVEEADEGEEEKEEEEELTRLGPQLLVWAHNSGLEMFKFCPVWAHNSLAGHTNPDWKCSNFVKFSISWARHY